jgi:hypothetical protein
VDSHPQEGDDVQVARNGRADSNEGVRHRSLLDEVDKLLWKGIRFEHTDLDGGLLPYPTMEMEAEYSLARR